MRDDGTTDAGDDWGGGVGWVFCMCPGIIISININFSISASQLRLYAMITKIALLALVGHPFRQTFTLAVGFGGVFWARILGPVSS